MSDPYDEFFAKQKEEIDSFVKKADEHFDGKVPYAIQHGLDSLEKAARDIQESNDILAKHIIDELFAENRPWYRRILDNLQIWWDTIRGRESK